MCNTPKFSLSENFCYLNMQNLYEQIYVCSSYVHLDITCFNAVTPLSAPVRRFGYYCWLQHIIPGLCSLTTSYWLNLCLPSTFTLPTSHFHFGPVASAKQTLDCNVEAPSTGLYRTVYIALSSETAPQGTVRHTFKPAPRPVLNNVTQNLCVCVDINIRKL